MSEIMQLILRKLWFEDLHGLYLQFNFQYSFPGVIDLFEFDLEPGIPYFPLALQLGVLEKYSFKYYNWTSLLSLQIKKQVKIGDTRPVFDALLAFH